MPKNEALRSVAAAILLLASDPAVAQDKATFDTRQLLPETGVRDKQSAFVRALIEIPQPAAPIGQSREA